MKKTNIAKLGFIATVISVGCTAGYDPQSPDTLPTPIYPGEGGGQQGQQAPPPGESIGASASPAPKGPLPNYGGTSVTLANSPPPISGGTLLALSDGTHVVAADSDRDRLYIVDLTQMAANLGPSAKLLTSIALSAHDEPGRLVEDDRGQVHVVLRSAGAIATIDVATATVVGRRNVCVSPRGITFDAARARLIIACDTGEIVSLSPVASAAMSSAISGAPYVITKLAGGLRDVVITETRDAHGKTSPTLYVSRFRTAETIALTMDGKVISTTRPSSSLDPTLAWRMIAPLATSSSQVPIVVHQFASLAPVATSPSAGGYGAGGNGAPSESGVSASCSKTAIVTPAISQGPTPLLLGPSTLVVPVDMVATDTGFAVIAAGNGHTAVLPQLFVLQEGECGLNSQQYNFAGQPVAVAKLADGSLMVQSREPATLTMLTKEATPTAGRQYLQELGPVTLATESVEDTGHAIFHSNSGSGIACASCHGEGGDDSHVWTFDTEGPRRTPSLRGTINGTAPYHWDGAMTDIGMIADNVMTGRMNGPQLSPDEKSALQSWLYSIPAPPLATSGDATLIAQGKALFESPSVGCSGCHSGPRFTNNTTVNVGTGGSFQVPPLVGVRARAPYLHDGCAKTLQDRFGVCATPQHGNITQLQPSEINALVEYLGSI